MNEKKPKTLEVHVMPKLPLDGITEPCTTPEERLLSGLQDAIDLASDQDQVTWLTDHGRRIAAIVPVSRAEWTQVQREAADAYAQQNRDLHRENLRLRDENVELCARLPQA
jgi:hypothetical protein